MCKNKSEKDILYIPYLQLSQVILPVKEPLDLIRLSLDEGVRKDAQRAGTARTSSRELMPLFTVAKQSFNIHLYLGL